MNTDTETLPSKLSRILCAIKEKHLASQTFTGFWDAYTEACLDYRVHGLNMPDSLAHHHIRNLEKRYPTAEGGQG